MLTMYGDPSSGAEVARLVDALGTTAQERAAIMQILNFALTDAFYTVLFALDGCASLGGVQQPYQVRDADGDLVCTGDGKVEALAYEYFYSDPSS